MIEFIAGIVVGVIVCNAWRDTQYLATHAEELKEQNGIH